MARGRIIQMFYGCCQRKKSNKIFKVSIVKVVRIVNFGTDIVIAVVQDWFERQRCMNYSSFVSQILYRSIYVRWQKPRPLNLTVHIFVYNACTICMISAPFYVMDLLNIQLRDVFRTKWH